MSDIIPQKRCSKCKQLKPATLKYFVPNRPSRTKYSLLAAQCKECRNTYQREKTVKKPRPDIPEGCRHCPKCGNNYPATTKYFGKDKHSKGELTSWCRTCRNTAQKLKKRRKSPRKLYLPDPTPTTYKFCPECKQEKLASVDNFPLNSHNKDGLYHVCKDCHKGYAARLAEKRATQPQEPMRTCTGPCSRTLPATTEYFPREGPGLRTRCKGCCGKQYKQYAQVHKEERKAQRREYTDANRELVRSYTRNRVALKKKAPGSHTIEDVKRQYERQKGKCYYCGKKLGKGKNAYHVDHVIPLSRGGSNSPDYLAIACPQCNVSKQDKLLHEWVEGGRLL